MIDTTHWVRFHWQDNDKPDFKLRKEQYRGKPFVYEFDNGEQALVPIKVKGIDGCGPCWFEVNATPCPSTPNCRHWQFKAADEDTLAEHIAQRMEGAFDD